MTFRVLVMAAVELFGCIPCNKARLRTISVCCDHVWNFKSHRLISKASKFQPSHLQELHNDIDERLSLSDDPDEREVCLIRLSVE